MINATKGRGKGQWWPTRDSDGNQSATYYCQQCGKPCGLQWHSISENGEVSPSVICPRASEVECQSCKFHDHLRLDGWLDYWISRSWCDSLENWWNRATDEEKKLAYKSAINSDCWKKERISFLEQQIAAAEGKINGYGDVVHVLG